MTEIIREQKVRAIIPGETESARLRLTDAGLTVTPRGVLSLLYKSIEVPFSQITRILWGNVHPDVTSWVAEEYAQYGLLVLRCRQQGFTPPMVFLTSSDTREWVAAIRAASPQTRLEQILDSYKFASRALIYDIKSDPVKPQVTLKIDETGTVFLTDAALYFCNWPAYSACTFIAWKDIAAITVPEVSFKMLNEIVWDYVDEILGEAVGWLVHEQAKEIPGVSQVEKGFKILKKILELERFFTQAGTFMVIPAPGRKLEMSHGGQAPQLLILSVSQLATCLKIARDCLKT